ncbi:MAG: hypothetical protein H0T79_00430 [Deltaproteobacteria bacterium]|nr:hypothetical protein [Deltaproteobacteria bacterium]
MNATPSLHGSPERIFVSVDESTGRSTISFAPADCGTPIMREDDKDGTHAMVEAKAILAKYPAATIHGPHFHAARAPGRSIRRKRPM